MIETGGGVSGALRSLCSPNVPLRANRCGFAIAFGSCLLQYMAATSAVKSSKRLEVVINCWCRDCWLPSEPQSQLTSPSQGREHLPKSGRLLPLNLRQQCYMHGVANNMPNRRPNSNPRYFHKSLAVAIGHASFPMQCNHIRTLHMHRTWLLTRRLRRDIV